VSKSTISTFQLFVLFPDEETARVYLEDRLWPKGPVCPDCKSGARVSALGTCATRKAGFYRCLACNFDFTIRTNTIFERSKVPLHKWLYNINPLFDVCALEKTVPMVRGMRKRFTDGYLFDAESSRSDYADAVKAGMTNWAQELFPDEETARESGAK